MPRIATLGPKGSFSEEAAIRFAESLGESEIVLLDNPEEIISLPEGVQYGVVAIENSLEGTIGHTLDLVGEMENTICGEVVLAIRHFLIGSPDTRSIGRIFSHPAAFAQCRRFIESNYPDCELVTVSSTAQGAMVSSTEKDSAAIASHRAADIYGLVAFESDIQDEDSFTRFLVIGRDPTQPTGNDKTSLIFTVKDTPGALYQALRPFAERNLNLTKIESRPARKGLGDYVFFLDFQCHASDPRSKGALEELAIACSSIKVLGSYPEATSDGPP